MQINSPFYSMGLKIFNYFEKCNIIVILFSIFYLVNFIRSFYMLKYLGQFCLGMKLNKVCLGIYYCFPFCIAGFFSLFLLKLKKLTVLVCDLDHESYTSRLTWLYANETSYWELWCASWLSATISVRLYNLHQAVSVCGQIPIHRQT